MVSKLKFKGDKDSSSKKKRKTTKTANNSDNSRSTKQQSSATDDEIVGWTTARSEHDLYGPIMILLVSLTTPIDPTASENV
jgi:hypothetical protein